MLVFDSKSYLALRISFTGNIYVHITNKQPEKCIHYVVAGIQAKGIPNGDRGSARMMLQGHTQQACRKSSKKRNKINERIKKKRKIHILTSSPGVGVGVVVDIWSKL